MTAVDHVENAWGTIEPEVLTKKTEVEDEAEKGDAEQGWNKFLACMFIAGSNKSKFEGYKKKLADDHADDKVSKHPETVELAVAVMQACLENHDDVSRKGANFAQVDLSRIKCCKCKKMGHHERDCPENDDGSVDGEQSNLIQPTDVWGGSTDNG